MCSGKAYVHQAWRMKQPPTWVWVHFHEKVDEHVFDEGDMYDI